MINIPKLRPVPWLRAGLCDALLGLALALGLLGLDAPDANWTLWLPLPLSLISAVLGLSIVWRERGDRLGIGWTTLGILLGCGVLVSWRPLASLAGVLPEQGWREVQAASVVIVTGTGLWLRARERPDRGLIAWLFALGVALLSLVLIRAKTLNYGPALELTIYSVGSAVWVGLKLRRGPPRLIHPPLPMAGVALLTGALLGWFSLKRLDFYPTSAVVGLEAGGLAMLRLWSQSVLFGWGPRTLAELAPVLKDPMLVMVPPWTGPLGWLAQFGLAGTLLLLVAAVWWIWRQVRMIGHGTWNPFCMPTLVLMMWVVVAAPLTLTPWLLLAGWVVLTTAWGWRGPGRSRQKVKTQGMLVLAPAIVLCGLAILFLSLLLIPVIGTAMARNANGSKMVPDVYREQLQTARSLNPFDPDIPLAMAGSLRMSMSTAQGWSEAAYLRVLAYYRAAGQLAPWDTLITWRQANFQESQGRPGEALQTLQQALVRQPNSQHLLGTLFFTALRHNQRELAARTLATGIAAEPYNPLWRQWEFLLAQEQGQASLAEMALNLVLTADPGNPALIHAAMANGTMLLPQLPEMN